MGKWKDISTAPKEDWEFILIDDGEEISIGFWSDDENSFCHWYQCCHYAPKANPIAWMEIPKRNATPSEDGDGG